MELSRSIEGCREECLDLKKSAGVPHSSLEAHVPTFRDVMKMGHTIVVCGNCIMKNL